MSAYCRSRDVRAKVKPRWLASWARCATDRRRDRFPDRRLLPQQDVHGSRASIVRRRVNEAQYCAMRPETLAHARPQHSDAVLRVEPTAVNDAHRPMTGVAAAL